MQCEWIFLLLFTIAGIRGKEHRCYVCVPPTGSQEVEKLFPNATLEVCGGTVDAKVCPVGFKGCLTQIQGEIITKTCGALSLNNCLNVNQIQYCYCRGELCNGEAESSPETLSAPPSDDEDLMEGSGTEIVVSTDSVPTTPTLVRVYNRSSFLSYTAFSVWQAYFIISFIIY